MYTGLEELLEYMYLIKNEDDLYIDDILVNRSKRRRLKWYELWYNETKVINVNYARG